MTIDIHELGRMLDSRLEMRRSRYVPLDVKTLSRNEIISSIAAVFEEQLTKVLEPGDPGEEFFESTIAWDDYFSSATPSETEVAKIIDLAKKDYYAYIVVRLASRFIPVGVFKQLDDWRQQEYLGILVKPPTHSGQRRYKNAQRDMLIVGQIKRLQQAGINPTRDPYKKDRNSGCDLVADAISRVPGRGMSYAAVERVWKRRNSLPVPRHLGAQLLSAIIARTQSV